MESLKEKLWRWAKKIKWQQDSTNKELYPIFKKLENYKKRKEELENEFNKLWHRKWENFVFNEWIEKTDIEWDSYITFLWNNYRKSWLRWRLYEIKKDDEWEWFIYIWGTDHYNSVRWSWQWYIMKSNWFLFDWRNHLMWWSWIRFAPNGMVYDWDTSLWEPLNPEEEDWFLHQLKWSYYEPHWKKTTYEIIPWISPKLNILNDESESKKLMYSRWKVVETTIEEIWKAIEHSFSSWNEEIKFTEDGENYIFTTPRWDKLCIPLEKWNSFIRSTADLINKAISLSKSERFDKFKADKENLMISYKLKPRNTNILKNAKEKLWIDAKDLAQRLNNYIYEDKYKQFNTPREKRWRPKKI